MKETKQTEKFFKHFRINALTENPIFEMRKLASILFVAVTMLFVSCEGPVGPVGPPGDDGFIGSVFEIQGDFTSGNGYRLVTDYPNNLTVYDSDVVLVYILWELADGMDVWRLCPQTVVLDEGVIQYNFDYTVADVQVFMEFTVPENSLLPAETDNQVFRIAVLPADYAKRDGVDISDLNTILNSPEIQMQSLDKVDLSSTLEVK
ncbi:hypothetical protein [uncultured Draconibacterium sp.]|uniref:hypothetical protein n=1 Tax=uncultured Draconibacterium sp. TaxID=1573823 RepID=UPI003216412E